jgi:hypothetical protein
MRASVFALATFVAVSCAVDHAGAVDRPPAFNIDKNCKAEAPGGGAGLESCTRDEKEAKDQLLKSWSRFRAPQKKACVGMSRIGGDQSYVELLTCLEMYSGAHFSAGNEQQQQPNAPESGSTKGKGPVWTRRH